MRPITCRIFTSTMDLINDIRRKNGCDDEMLRRAESDPEIASTITALRSNLAQALESQVASFSG